jgi:hypothetical protein
MRHALRLVAAGVLALAFGLGAITPITAGAPVAIAKPLAGSIPIQGGPAPLRRIPWPWLPKIRVSASQVGASRLPDSPPVPNSKLAIDFSKLFGRKLVIDPEKIVAKAACHAMELVYLGTGQHDYWEEAIWNEVPDGIPFAEEAIADAVDRAANAISAAEYGPRFARLYFDVCYLKKVG